MTIKNYIKYRLIFIKESLFFRYKVFKANGFIGRPLYLSNSRYIHIGEHVRLKDNYRIECYPLFYQKHYNPEFVIGNRVNIGHNFTAFVADRLEIGDDTILAGNVTLVTENHGTDPESKIPYHAQDLVTGPVIIGEGCWLGQNVVVLPNVTIGDKVVIGANSVVTQNIPSYSIAVGVPARVVKSFSFNSKKWQK